MTIKTFVAGVNTSFSPQLNSNFATSLRAAGLNTVRQLIDRDIDFAAGTTDCFADAYVDSDGRENTVNAGSTTAIFLPNKYTPVNIGSNENYSNTAARTSNNDYTFNLTCINAGIVSEVRMTKAGAVPTLAIIEIIQSSTVIATTSVSSETDYTFTLPITSYLRYIQPGSFSIRIYRPGGGNDLQKTSSAQSYSGTNFSITSQQINSVSSGNSIVFTPYSASEKVIVHDIPSGRLPATISSACLVPFIQDWETGADIQYKITNGSSDTGWLSCGTSTPISNFAAFSTEPTTLTIKLIPKSSSPTPGFPSIRGFVLFAE